MAPALIRDVSSVVCNNWYNTNTSTSTETIHPHVSNYNDRNAPISNMSPEDLERFATSKIEQNLIPQRKLTLLMHEEHPACKNPVFGK